MIYSKIMPAQYRANVESDFAGSPYIEALPPMVDLGELKRRLGCVPLIENGWREMSRVERINKLLLLTDHAIFVALPRHVDAAFKIQSLLYQGYLFRDHPGWPRCVAEEEAVRAAQARGSASAIGRVIRGGAFLGPSGCGKTTTIDRCCAMFPQIIYHGSYKGQNFTKTQLVYVRVQCPENASEKGLVQAFFSEIDSLLGTSDFERYSASRNTLNTMMEGVAMRCRENAIGMIILDEVEALHQSASNPSQLAQFLTRLSNVTRTPIVKLGLPSARGLLGKDMYQARRSMGFSEWDYLARDTEWKDFADELFQIYLLREKPNWAQISDCLFKMSSGVPDIAIQLFKHAQVSCLTYQEERLTPKRLLMAFGNEAKIIRDALDLLARRKAKRPPSQKKKGDVGPSADPSGDLQGPAE